MSVAASGTQTATVGTEHDLATTITTAGAYVLVVDANALAAGESVTVGIYEKVLSGGTQRKMAQYAHSWPGSTTVPVLQTPAFNLEIEGKVTLTQAGGSSRAFPWSLRKL
jgi:hypothetical protein